MDRTCSRIACTASAVATLTYVYADQMAVLGPLAVAAEPHSYDLCARHAERTSAPQGWQVVRHSVLGDDLVGGLGVTG
ncbi:DUF3499 family protein [Agromyces mangrovi Wang et al. 2018]|uniref:DUF3499 family protein n=1 Tax=Agromyces mangrovi TaxID=1858653 RepID=UPI0025747446|nr:DUF3499 family protein [Agromyces mangrovi]BDZ65808.1 hypothetical protein GCM10025877_27460 [Agromyces mangrovi]